MWRFFAGRRIEALTSTAGPILEQNPHFRVLRAASSEPKDLWTYISIGGLAATDAENFGTEFIICTAMEDVRAIELLAMTVFYNRGGKLRVSAMRFPLVSRGR